MTLAGYRTVGHHEAEPGSFPTVHAAPVWSPPAAEMVIGTLGPSLRIDELSPNVEALTGIAARDLVGTLASESVHPDDVPTLLGSVADALAGRAGVSTSLRLRRSAGDWCRVRVVLNALEATGMRIGFVLLVPGPEPADPSGRVAELERQLRDIAEQIQATGITEGAGPDAELEDLAVLDELSDRQWEVLRRLCRGQRVPSIAAELFVSQSTVRNHLSAIYQQVGVASQVELLDLIRHEGVRA